MIIMMNMINMMMNIGSIKTAFMGKYNTGVIGKNKALP